MLKPEPNGFKQAKSMEEVGIKLLQSIGCSEDEITAVMIADAIQANDAFIAKLQAIAAAARGKCNDACAAGAGITEKTPIPPYRTTPR